MTMTKEYYESLGNTYQPDSLYTDIDLSKTKEIKNVELIQDITALEESMNNMLSTMKTMIVLIIVIAILLGSVIIYNMGILSYTEKQYQFATLKVLGFYDKEVDNYINKENVIFTIIGIALGLVFGTFLTSAIISSIEIDRLRFTRNILTSSYIWSAIITASFSFIVNKIIHFILKKIDMIESLKSVE